MDPLQFKLAIIGIIVSGLGGGLAGAFINHFPTMSRDRKGRRRGFRGYIKPVISELKSMNLKKLTEGDLFRRHQNTVAGIRNECAKITEDIRFLKRNQFESAWSSCCGLRQDQVEPRDPYNPIDPASDPMSFIFPNYDRGREALTKLLNEMIQNVS